MKKRILFILLTFILIFSFCVPDVFAHPGKTDENGGHTDWSTGEYHYHHGYSEHDHYDMNNDGVLDCPYDFVDKTDHSSGDSTQNNSQNDRDNFYDGNGKNNFANIDTKATTNLPDANPLYRNIIFCFLILMFILINGLAFFIFKSDKSEEHDTSSALSVFVSVLSTVIVFSIAFIILFLSKAPFVWISILEFTDMLEILLFSAIISGIPWLVANWASLMINTLLCSLFKIDVYGWAGAFQRLTIPLSYAFTVFLFILK